VRRFNETFQQLYRRPPGSLRRQRAGARSPESPEISLLLPYRPPYDWSSMIRFLERRAIAGVEIVAGDRYSRTIELEYATGSITVAHEPRHSALRAIVRFPELNALPTIVARIRRMFDLSADPGAIAAVLSADPVLKPLLARRPGLRVPGGLDVFETAVRALLGQQITVTGATQLAGRLVAVLGTPVAARAPTDGLTHAFPRPEKFGAADLSSGMPKTRAAALRDIAIAASRDPHLFDPRDDLAKTITRLRELPGVGEWTAQYIAMRGLGESDAFLADDVGVLTKFAACAGRRSAAADLLRRAEAWRPWRAYAVMHLWMADATIPKQPRSRKSKETRYAVTA
jgi:AraC family transcriptional regulator of adaptative response / DNA-3-methyladenine glycosylase II